MTEIFTYVSPEVVQCNVDELFSPFLSSCQPLGPSESCGFGVSDQIPNISCLIRVGLYLNVFVAAVFYTQN